MRGGNSVVWLLANICLSCIILVAAQEAQAPGPGPGQYSREQQEQAKAAMETEAQKQKEQEAFLNNILNGAKLQPMRTYTHYTQGQEAPSNPQNVPNILPPLEPPPNFIPPQVLEEQRNRQKLQRQGNGHPYYGQQPQPSFQPQFPPQSQPLPQQQQQQQQVQQQQRPLQYPGQYPPFQPPQFPQRPLFPQVQVQGQPLKGGRPSFSPFGPPFGQLQSDYAQSLAYLQAQEAEQAERDRTSTTEASSFFSFLNPFG